MNITVFTTNTCAYCAMVKKYLTSKGVEYETVNLDEHPERRDEVFKLSGVMSTPVTLVGDSKVIVGWNPAQLAQAINT